MALVAPVKADRITGEQAAHQFGHAGRAGAKQEMGMVAHQRPGIARGPGGRHKLFQPVDKIVLVGGFSKDFAFFNAPDDHMVQYARCIDSG